MSKILKYFLPLFMFVAALNAEPRFNGTISFASVGTLVNYNINQIYNNSSIYATGTIKIEVYGSYFPYSGGVGYGTALYSALLDPLYANYAYNNLTGTVAFNFPPGNYTYLVVLLEEYSLAGYKITDYINVPVSAYFPTYYAAPAIVTQPTSSAVNTGSSKTFSIVASGSATLTYQWSKNGVVIAGATASTYSINSATASDAGNYTVVVANSAGSMTSSTATLTVNATIIPPSITTQSGALTVTAYNAASFTVSATGTAPLSYQWKKDGISISGANSSTYSIDSTATSDSGNYTVVVSNSAGSATSNPAALTVIASNIVSKFHGASIRSSLNTLSSNMTAVFTIEGSSKNMVIYFLGPKLKDFGISDNLSDPKLEIFNASTGALVASNDNWADNKPDAITVIKSNVFTLSQNSKDAVYAGYFPKGTYIVKGASVDGGFGQGLLGVFETDNAPRLVYLALKGYVDSTASSTVKNISIGFSINSNVADAACLIRAISTSVGGLNSLQDPQLFIYNDRGNLLSGASNDNWASGSSANTDSIIKISDKIGLQQLSLDSKESGLLRSFSSGDYVAQISPTAPSSGQFIFEMSEYDEMRSSSISPVVVNNPESASILTGESLTLGVAANASPVRSYQWKKDGAVISGATSSTYKITTASVKDAGNYNVTISNSLGSVTSADAIVAVNKPIPPVITSQPQSVTLIESSASSNVFSVIATGSPTLTYQWKLNGTAISGANSSSYMVYPVTPDKAGFYSVLVSNIGGSVESAAALLTLVTKPTIINQPVSLSVAAPNSATFSVGLGAENVYTYQWYKNGIKIVGATSLVYTLNSTATSDAGSYSVVVTTGAGSVTSASAVLKVLAPHISNMSIRTTLKADQIVTVGFTMTGGAKNVVLRAVGPSLFQFGVPTFMSDPRLDLYSGSTRIAVNDNWGGSTTLAGIFQSVGAFGYSSPTSLDAALATSIDGGRTLQVYGPVGGVVLVEAYDATSSDNPRFTNVSARNIAGIGADTLIAGFTLTGEGKRNLLIRAVGPKLTLFNVTGVLADPKLGIYSGETKIAENDDWDPSLAPVFSSAGAFALDLGSKDAAIKVSLPAGGYTVQVSGADGGVGEALVEIYELP